MANDEMPEILTDAALAKTSGLVNAIAGISTIPDSKVLPNNVGGEEELGEEELGEEELGDVTVTAPNIITEQVWKEKTESLSPNTGFGIQSKSAAVALAEETNAIKFRVRATEKEERSSLGPEFTKLEDFAKQADRKLSFRKSWSLPPTHPTIHMQCTFLLY